MNNYYQNNETEIDLIGVCVYVLKQWRKLLIFFLIGALIGCGVSYFKMDTMAPENIGTYLASLEDEDIDEDNIRLYADYQALYDAALERGETAVILNMDENNVWSTQLNYFITCEYGKIDEIIAYYKSLLIQDNNLNKILSASGLDCTTKDIKDLISLSSWKIDLDNQIVTSDSPIEIRNANLSVSITSPNEECLKKMTEQVSAILEDTNRDLSGQVERLTITKLSESTSFGYSGGVAAEKIGYVSARQELLKKATDISGKMSDDEKLYYAYNYDWDEYLENYERGFSKMWPAIAAVVLAFLTAGWYAVRYICDKKIKSEDEIERIFGLRVLGSVDNSNYKNIFDKLFDKWGKASLAPPNSEDYLLSVLNSINADSIALVFDSNDEQSKKLSETFSSGDARIHLAGNLACDKDAAKIVSDCGNVVMIAHMSKISKPEFAKILEASKRLGAENWGAIVIR